MRILISLLTLSVFATTIANGQDDPGLDLFRKHVRADLIHHCIECHGGKSIKADFDLSTREALMDSGFVAKSADDSYLMDLIRHSEEPEMPFKKPKLSAEIIARIGKWIDLGAPYDAPLAEANAEQAGAMVVTDDDREFWSFQPLSKPSPPTPKNMDWCRTPIDQFIMAALESRGMTANKDADERTLQRRASFGLLGLPPANLDKNGMIETSDSMPERTASWEEQIDTLLASPHYGERWARHWMDVARFAESHGYEQDYDRKNAYHYRDFLIKAFNDDMPYDQFVKWQLAGDEFAPHDPLAKMATGFLGAGVFPTQLTETEFESTRYDELDDMTATTGVAFLGLSIGCARCHDHKFDPIPTSDYYRIAATFTKTIRSEVDLDIDPEANEKRRTEFAAKTAGLQKKLAEYESKALQKQFDEWISNEPDISKFDPWVVLKPQDVDSNGKRKVLDDGSILSEGSSPNQDVVKVTAEIGELPITALRIEALAHESLPVKGPGLAANGNFVLSDIKVRFGEIEIAIKSAQATHQQDKGQLSVAASIDKDSVSGWAVDKGGIGKDNAAVFTFDKPFQSTKPGKLTVELTFNHPNPKHILGRMRLSVSSQSQPSVAVGNYGPDVSVLAAVKTLRRNLTDTAARKTAIQWFRTTQPEWKAFRKLIDDHKAAGDGVRRTKVQINSENIPKPGHHANGRGYPHFYEQTHLLVRGDVNQKAEVAEPGLLQVVSKSNASIDRWQVNKPDDASTEFTRARLATWLTDPENVSGQLAARVIVNRVWQHHFGRGIVATPNDFGYQGERPTHPELLEWLAADFIEHGWKLKRLHKMIMTSSVYRQSSAFDAERNKIDPDNQLLWRRTPRRLEAEAIRDAMLVTSGQLDTRMHGPGTLDANMKRRSIYFFIKRSKLIPMMMLFDWPEHLVSIGQRSTTTIAPQALMFMNSPQGRQYAEAFANRLTKQLPVENAYQLAFGRKPTADEQRLAETFLEQQVAVYEKAENKDAAKLALADFCQTLMSMNEFIYVD